MTRQRGTGPRGNDGDSDKAAAPRPSVPPVDVERLVHELQVHQVELEQQNEELREAQAEIAAGLTRYTDLYDFAPIGYISLSTDGVIGEANLAAAALFGVPRSALRGRHFRSYVALRSTQELGRFLKRLMAGEQDVTCELDLVAPDARALVGRLHGTYDQAAEICRVAVLDLTEQRRTEAALRTANEHLAASQRLEAIGRLAGGVAHDFNNILMAINGTAELLAMSLPEGDPRRADAAIIRESGERAAALARQLLAFGRRQTLRPAAISLRDAILALAPLLRRTLGADIQLELDLDAELDPVRVDPVQLEQVVVNLAFNARDSMPDGGRLVIALAPAGLLPATRHGGPAGVERNFARLSISDSGTGIAPSLLPHIFEPFFTTKGLGRGTGLGLATVDGIVGQSEGWIEVQSTLGGGSTFNVLLPCAPADPAVAVAEGAPAAHIEGSETLLLVEDEDAVRFVTARLLRQLGYSVIEAAGPGEALAIPTASLSSLALVIIDVVMPLMNGDRLSHRLAERRPGLRTLFISGFAPDGSLRQRLLDPGTGFLVKPFSREQLGAAVRRAIDGD